MTPAEVAKVLAKAAAFDQRTVGEADVMAWHEILNRLEFGDALEAVTRHYTETRERLMPADVIRHARAVRDERTRAERTAAPRALPSRYEDDEERNLRIKEGVSQCRDVLKPVMDMLAAKRRLRLDEAAAADTEDSTEDSA